MAPGRPTDYDPKYCDEIIDYFNVEPYKEKTVTHTKKNGESWETYEDVANDLPTLAGFAREIGVHRETLNNWAEKHKDFFDAVKKVKEIQEDILITNSLKNLYAQPFSIFFAKNVMGWKDRTELSGDPENPLVPNIAGVLGKAYGDTDTDATETT